MDTIRLLFFIITLMFFLTNTVKTQETDVADYIQTQIKVIEVIHLGFYGTYLDGTDFHFPAVIVQIISKNFYGEELYVVLNGSKSAVYPYFDTGGEVYNVLINKNIFSLIEEKPCFALFDDVIFLEKVK